jgi:hypothetical protein
MEELARPRGDKPFGWLEALRRLIGRRGRRPSPCPRPWPDQRPHLLPDDLHKLAAPR